MRLAERACEAPGAEQSPVLVGDGVSVFVANHVGETDVIAGEIVVQLQQRYARYADFAGTAVVLPTVNVADRHEDDRHFANPVAPQSVMPKLARHFVCGTVQTGERDDVDFAHVAPA